MTDDSPKMAKPGCEPGSANDDLTSPIETVSGEQAEPSDFSPETVRLIVRSEVERFLVGRAL